MPISTLQFSNTVTSRLVVLISTFYKLSYTLELLKYTASAYDMFAVILCLILVYGFTHFHSTVMTYTITLSYFVISYFHIFLL